MGFFRSNPDTYTCKLCHREFVEEYYNHEFGICNSCLLLSGVHVNQLKNLIPEYQEKANLSSDPAEKISYLSAMLELLYKYKILYADNDVHLINEDVDEMIDDVIDCISEAKL